MSRSNITLSTELKKLGYTFKNNHLDSTDVYGKTVEFETKNYLMVVTDTNEVFIIVRHCILPFNALKQYINNLQELIDLWRFLTNEYICEVVTETELD